MSEAAVIKRKRGRPVKVARDLTAAEVADLLGFRPAVLQRLLARRPSLFFGAEGKGDDWRISERALMQALGDKRRVEPRLSVQEIAEALGLDEQTIYSWTRLEGPGGKRLLPSMRICGHVRVKASDFEALPSEWPAWAPSRPHSFFAHAEEDAA